MPQAVFWRSLKYFTSVTHFDEDGLDEYEGAAFGIGNRSFDLRKYNGHPAFTCSLYFPSDMRDMGEVLRTIKEVIVEMAVPKTAIAWRRGQPTDNGLHREPKDRLRESEARVLSLKIASLLPSYTASTEQIKRAIPGYFPLSSLDLTPSPVRRNEQLWQQIVGNVVSHRASKEGPFMKGYATRTADGLSVTQKGLDYLKRLGFSS
jgi:hypothetical protein